MMLRTLYHKRAAIARGAAENLLPAGVITLGAAAAAAVILLCTGASVGTENGVGLGDGGRRVDPHARTAVCAPAEAGSAAPTDSEEAETEIVGGPFTEEYDYSLEIKEAPEIETETEITAQIEPEESAGVMLSAEPDPEPEPEPQPEESVPVGAWTETDEVYARMIAQTLWGECRGCAPMEQAAVAWCILNRVDSPERYFPDDVAAVIVQPSQFLGYAPDNPVTDELYMIARDVLSRWYAERAGAADVGRVLPRGYCYFWGDGRHNYFTEVWRGADVWDWTLGTPYGEGEK